MMERLAIPVRASKCTQMKQEFADLQLRTHYFSISRGGAILIPLETDSPLVADANAPLALFFIL